MKIITVYNEKGGVGKTTLAAILGAGLAMRDYKVLLVDADGQGDLTKNMKIPMQSGFYNFIKRNDKESPDYIPTKNLLLRPPQDKHPKNLYVIAGNTETWGIPTSTRLQGIVGSIALRFAEIGEVFDYCIIDTQPSASTLHDAIALVTDYFVVPTDAEPLSAYGGLKSALEHINGVRQQSLQNGRDKAKLMGIVPNKYDARTKLHQHVLDTLIETYGEKVWQPLPKRINISEAQLLQTSLMFDAPDLETNEFLWAFIDRVDKATQEAING